VLATAPHGGHDAPVPFLLALGLDRAALTVPLGTLLALGAGRTLLSLLPAGATGSHAPRKLAETALLVALLGGWLWLLSFALASFLGQSVELVPLALVSLVGLVRWRLGPHEFVPQHELEEPRRTWLARLALGLALASSFTPLVRGESGPAALGCAMLAALAWWLARTLERAGRSPLGAALVALGFVAFDQATVRSDSLAVFALQALVALAASGQVGWLRRADARERALALFGGCAAALFAPVFTIAGLAGCWATTHRHARKALRGATLLALAAVALPSLAASRQLGLAEALADEATGATAIARLYVLAIAGAAALAGWRGGVRRPAFAPERPAPPGRELAALGILCGLPLLAAFALGPRLESLGLSPAFLGPASLELAACAVAPAAALFTGLVFVRARAQ
jgi:hypothetical protein